MRGALLAAGTGDRLRAGGFTMPKALLPVGGATLIERILRELAAAGTSEVVAIVNEESRDVIAHVQALREVPPTRFVVRSTPSSLASLLEILPQLRGEPFLLTTVDAVTPRGTLARFGARATALGADVVLAVTDFIDDEKPLRLRFDESGRVTALGATVTESTWVTAGFYWLGRGAQAFTERGRARTLPSLRWLLQAFVEEGLDVRAVAVGKTIDVDRPEDIAAAVLLVEAEAAVANPRT